MISILGPSTSEAVVTNNPAALTTSAATEHALLGKSNSLATSAAGQASKTHR